MVHLVIAAIVGWLAQRLLGYREIDFLTTLGVGLVGSLIGNGIARWLNLPYAFPGDTLQRWAGMSIPYSILGCIILIAGVNLIMRNSNKREKS